MTTQLLNTGKGWTNVLHKAELPVMSDRYSESPEDFYFPINVHQVEDLLGKTLTHIEAMNLPSSVEKANKDLVRQTIWKWFETVQENSLTSYKGIIAPIELLPKAEDEK